MVSWYASIGALESWLVYLTDFCLEPAGPTIRLFDSVELDRAARLDFENRFLYVYYFHRPPLPYWEDP